MCYPSTAQTLTNPANPPSPPNPTRHHLKNPAAHPLTPPHHPTRSTIQSTQPLPPPLSPQLSTSPTQKHLSNTSTTPKKTKHCHHLKNHSSHPTIYTSPSFCSTSFTSNLLPLTHHSTQTPTPISFSTYSIPAFHLPSISSPCSPQTATFTSYSALTSPLDSAPFI